jgi:hypothetical protein
MDREIPETEVRVCHPTINGAPTLTKESAEFVNGDIGFETLRDALVPIPHALGASPLPAPPDSRDAVGLLVRCGHDHLPRF